MTKTQNGWFWNHDESVFVSPTLFYIGYESGHIIKFSPAEHKPNVNVKSKEGTT